jgi:phosphate-selective porin OprO/OprP
MVPVTGGVDRRHGKNYTIAAGEIKRAKCAVAASFLLPLQFMEVESPQFNFSGVESGEVEMQFKAAVIVLAVFLSCAVCVRAQDDPLVDVLVKKGVITEAEAKALRESKKPVRDALTDLLRQKGVITEDEAAKVQAAPKPAEPKKDEGPFYWKSGELEAKLSGYTQLWYVGTQDDNDVNLDNADTFAVRRARLLLTGSVTPWNEFLFQYDIRDSVLRDAKVTFKDMPFTKDSFLENFSISIGQYKLPFTDQTIRWGGWTEEFIRGAMIYDTGYNGRNANWLTIADRDIGVAVNGLCWDKMVEWNLGVYNGTGINGNDNNDQKDMLLRIWASPWKNDKESALAGLTFGGATMFGYQDYIANALYAAGGKGTATGALGNMRERYAATVKYNYKDFFAYAEWVYQSFERFNWTAAGERDDRTDVDTYNWYVALGYKFMPEVQGVLRYQEYSPSQVIEDDNVDCITAGVNWFVNGSTRLMLNYDWINEQDDEISNDQVTLQLELRF